MNYLFYTGSWYKINHKFTSSIKQSIKVVKQTCVTPTSTQNTHNTEHTQHRTHRSKTQIVKCVGFGSVTGDFNPLSAVPFDRALLNCTMSADISSSIFNMT